MADSKTDSTPQVTNAICEKQVASNDTDERSRVYCSDSDQTCQKPISGHGREPLHMDINTSHSDEKRYSEKVKDAQVGYIFSRKSCVLNENSIEGADSNNERARRVRQDGGYAWLVLCCTFSIMFLNHLMWTSYGIYIIEFRDNFPRSKGLFAWMYGTNVATVGLTGIVAGPLVKLTSPRVVALLGSVLVASGYLIGALSPNTGVLFFAYGVLLGIGNSFMNMASNVATQQYFSKRRTFANGLLLTGSSLNMFVAPPLVNFLIECYGWRGAYLIQSAAVLNGVPAALLLVPFPTQQSPKPAVKPTDKPTSHSKAKTVLRLARTICACHLLRYVPFLLIEVGSVCFFLAHHTPIVFTVSRAVQLGISRQQASIVMSVWAATSTAGQIVLGWVGDKIWRGPFMALSLVCAGVVLLLSILCTSFPLQLAYSAIFGLTLAGYMAMKIPTLVDILGIENLAAAHGINLLLGGVSGILGPTISNMIAERSGSYVVSFAVAGILIIMAGVFMLTAVLYEPCVKRLNRKTPATTDRFTDTAYSHIHPLNKMTSQNDDAFLTASVHSLHERV